MIYTIEELKEIMEENGGSLDLRCTGITALPEGLTVGGSLDLRGTGITARKYKKLKNGDFHPEKYIYCDGIFTLIKRVKTVDKYTYFLGKIKEKNVVFDGENFAHCRNFREGVADLEFKAAKDRGADQYKKYNLDSVIKTEEAITMYRVITGACQAGTRNFLEKLGDIKEEYSINEIIEITKGNYGAETFKRFFVK